MEKTPFSGLTVLDPDESIYADNSAFISRDRREIDRALQIGVKTHRHDGTNGLPDPLVAPSGLVIGSGGTIPAGISLTLGYTLEDQQGGETAISPTVLVTTPSPLSVPSSAPLALVSYASGTLDADTFTYAVTWSDGEGGETPVGPSVTVTRDPGFANGRIALSGLDDGMEEAEAVGWRLYRARSGGEYVLLAEGTGDTYTDDGSVSPQCDVNPPPFNTNTTGGTNQLQFIIPGSAAIGTDAVWINLYASQAGDFAESCLLAQVPVGSAGASPVFPSLDLLDAQPPDTNRSYGGANQIDPDIELIDWHWKRPVGEKSELPSALEGSELGDVRIVEETLIAYIFDGSKWVEWTGGGGGGGGAGSGLTLFSEGIVGNELTDDFITDTIGEGLWAGQVKGAKIEGGNLYPSFAEGAFLLRRTDAVIDPEENIQRFVVKVDLAAALGSVTIYASYKDSENYLDAIFNPSAELADTFYIQKKVGGSFTTLKEGGGNVLGNSGAAWFEALLNQSAETLTMSAYTVDPESEGASPVFTQTFDLTPDKDVGLFFGVDNQFGLGQNASKAEGDNVESFFAKGIKGGQEIEEITRMHFEGTGLTDVSISETAPGEALVTVATNAAAAGMGVILYGTDPATPRGTDYKQYTWIGKEGTTPENADEYDVVLQYP